METVTTIKDVREIIGRQKAKGRKIGFVPTMGFLHDGHLSLVEISKRYSDFQVMSIFVNKIQFNDLKDFENYPREIEKDIKLADKSGVDLVFLPEDDEIYRDMLTYIDMTKLTDHLCGAHRQGHFRGVFIVVSKLFNIIQPDVAVFGQKDIQQVITIEKMVFDLNFPVRIIIAPIMREKDGLAMSSRNKHLNEEERANSLSIYRSFQKAEELIKKGERSSNVILKEMTDVLIPSSPDKIDYISVVSYDDLQPVDKIQGKSVIAVAAFFGTTRLIDNMIIDKGENDYKCIY